MPSAFYAVCPDLLASGQRDRLVEGIVGCEFLGPSALGPEFVRTTGFSVVFRRLALGTVCRVFPYLRELPDALLFAECNAFYVNTLIMQSSSRVEPHIDCRLLSHSQTRLIPNLISIYYAQIPPDMVGGRLVLNPGEQQEVTVAPRQGDTVHFVGSTVHLVEEVRTPCRRLSVVCEQYNLSEALSGKFPICEVLTGASKHSRVNALDKCEV